MITSSTYNQQNRANWLAVDGNSIEYAKDANGNITQETYKSGADVVFIIHNVYDADGDIMKSYTTTE